ncbi:hypothetical protein K435DRAFT_852438 [Dendrothele bispora CBS 962.96]|uniref:Heterokaryon incompatibility domain-containing protein n=1 Tax=Dendrothele bispora (strain CBS 962.96) TaxID=1314807 RepID=A0A4S8MJI2_DENBC|nr:hypothetical protein K435DRAFT_852438 [Dendrothele bispora CBS 962.96]
MAYSFSSHYSLSIESTATPCRIRFINCRALVEEDTLVIEEFDEFPFPWDSDSNLPEVLHAAISYVWKGNPPPVIDSNETESEALDLGYFNVLGCEDGDPISISVLRSACLATLFYLAHPQVNYIWLDRLCIIQTNNEDKSWQITRMFDVYKNADPTIILPGGIQRLVPLDEETAWVHRAWTLQEALARPYAAFVLHLWEDEAGIVGGLEEETEGAIHVVQVPGPGRKGCALMNLDNLVEACAAGRLRWTPGMLGEDETPQQLEAREWRTVEDVRIIGASGAPSLHAFLDALRTLNSDVDSFRDYAIWKSALTRTSSRPVDMVFSIMGLLGVTLDPKAFGEDDRIGATIALAREILRKGGSASWIGVSTSAPPCRQLSTFPEFPETSVAGKALIRISAGDQEKIVEAGTIVDEDSLLGSVDIPDEEIMVRGEMDKEGYLSFRRRACIVTPVTAAVNLADCTECQRIREDPANQHLSAQSVDGKAWHFHEGVNFNKGKFPRVAVPLAFFSEVSLSVFEEHDVLLKLMLVQEHAPGKFHIISYFKIPDWDMVWERKVTLWEESSFTVGGPDIEKSNQTRDK